MITGHPTLDTLQVFQCPFQNSASRISPLWEMCSGQQSMQWGHQHLRLTLKLLQKPPAQSGLSCTCILWSVPMDMRPDACKSPPPAAAPTQLTLTCCCPMNCSHLNANADHYLDCVSLKAELSVSKISPNVDSNIFHVGCPL